MLRLIPLIFFALMLPSVAQADVGSVEDAIEQFVQSCPFPVPPTEIEGETIRCGYVSVPESHTQAEGRQIQIAFAIVKSTSATPAADPLVYLEGGPGGSAMFSVNAWLRSPFREVRDIVLIDQRGTGYSLPRLHCNEASGRVFSEDGRGSYLDALERCAARLIADGSDLNAYNSRENAQDIAEVVDILGYDSVNLYGLSYGTRLALTIMRDHPESVRSVILDSTYPMTVNIYQQTALNSYRVFNQLFQDCANDIGCRLAYPNLEFRFFKLVDELNADPLPLNRFWGELDGDDLVDSMFRLFYRTDVLPYLPQMLDGLTRSDAGVYLDIWRGELPPRPERVILEPDTVDLFMEDFDRIRYQLNFEDFQALLDDFDSGTADTVEHLAAVIERHYPSSVAAQLIERLRAMTPVEVARTYDEIRFENVSQSVGMYLSVMCQDEVPFNDYAAAEQSALDAAVPVQLVDPELSALDEVQQACARWGVAESPLSETQPVTSDIPTLVLAGGYDPITPPQWGFDAAETLSNSFVYVFPGVGHGILATGPCPQSITDAFLAAPSSEPDGSCVGTMGLTFFAGENGQPVDDFAPISNLDNN